MFKYAIARTPGRSLTDGISQTPELGKPIYELALKQHQNYIEALRQCGLEVKVLEPKEEFPDSTFIEDNALCTPKGVAILSRPGALTRREEAKLPDLRDALDEHFSIIEEIEEPGTVDPGDILMVGEHFYVGVSGRTNDSGADQVIRILEKYGMTAEKVEVTGILHLKDDVVYLDNNTLIVAEAYADHPTFSRYNRLVVENDEYYAVNSLWVNGKVIVPEGYPKIEQKIRDAGYEVVLIDMSEFKKVTGSLTCLSLRF